MNRKTEKDIILYYLNNLLKRPMYGNIEDRVCDWFEENARVLIGKDIENLWEDGHRGWRRKQGEDKPTMPRDSRTIKKLLAGNRGRLVVTPEVSAIFEAFHFSPEYRDILTLRVNVANIPLLADLAESHRTTNLSMQTMAAMLDMPQKKYEKFYSQSSELVEKGLFEVNRRREWNPDTTDTFAEILISHCRTPQAVKRTVLGKPQKATLKPEHFEHLREEYVWLRNLLANALAKKQRGVNVLIYGKPGTGKTEMAKTLCREIGISLYSVSESMTDELNGVGRRSALAAALSVLQDDRDTVLLMDEAEDTFGVSPFHGSGFFGFFSDPDPSQRKSKLYFNRLLERNAVPVIWIGNSIRGVDPAHLRRFSYALNMEAPDEAVQARIWSLSARKNRVRLPKEKIDSLVRDYDIAPGIIDASLRTAALTGDQDAIEKTIESLQTAMHGHSAKKLSVREHEFSPALLNCDLDLENLTRRILELKGVNFSLCLYGIPGSGKSAYARYLAERMKMKVLQKRASDLLNPFVGVTERLIAEAFTEARKKKMLLVVDEADSFLQDRRGAHRSWEVTQVNEMLTQMESHPLPFVCTTNLMDGLDQASLRRFTFKVKYDFLNREQVAAAFRHFFGAEPTISLTGLNCLAPGDFAVVAKKARICGIESQNELVDMLRQEQDVKDVRRGSLGFSPEPRG